jgi:AbrB family looped-hinge helix DNA binding protein
MSKTRVTSKGQVTIPIEVRRALGIREGDALRFDLQENGALLRKTSSARTIRGSVPKKQVSWPSARRKAWRARAERLAGSSATRTS